MAVNLNDPRLQAALQRVNMYRHQAGAPPCALHPALVQAAQAHADYFSRNAPLADPHEQASDKPGFTGADWFARCRAAGYANYQSTNECVTFLVDPVAAVDSFMATVNHRAPLLDPSYPDIGFGLATTPGEARAICVIDFGMPVWKEVFDTAWICYPPEGGLNIALKMYKEGPDPFAGFPARYPIGNPVTVQYRGAGQISFEGVLFTLTDSTGQAVPIFPLPKPAMFATRQSAALAAQQPLQPDTTYTVTFGYSLNREPVQQRTWRFSTGPALAPARPLDPAPGLTKADPTVRQLWQLTDGPVAGGKLARTWLYGPDIFDGRWEPYDEAPDHKRAVYYFDKARMEITNPDGDRSSQWFITTGRLVYELISGRVQMGDNHFETRAPAQVPVAGDPAAVNGEAPTYASFGAVASLNNDRRVPARTGQAVLEAIDRAGQVQTLPLSPAPVPVKYYYYDSTLGHNVPDVFMRWMNDLPGGWLFVLGLPLSEPYWSRVKLGGVVREVLVQVFERRTVTFTPSNSPAWQVEMGNVGQHYHFWRYNQN